MEMAGNTTHQFIDIVSPVMPVIAEYTANLLLFGFTVLLAAILLLLWRWYHSTAQVSLRQLKRIRRACLRQQLTPRMTGYWLAALLKQQLGIQHLSNTVALPAAISVQQSRWDTFTRRLHQVRYAPRSCDLRDIETLISETRYWLRHWP